MVVIFHVFYVCFAIYFFFSCVSWMLSCCFCTSGGYPGGLDGLGMNLFGAKLGGGEKYHVFDLLIFRFV
jgi:hypothetical protein